jgi:hypothetical protein
MLVPEKCAWRYRNLPMLIPFSVRWKGSGIAQDVAPFLDEITKQQRLRERAVRHDAPPLDRAGALSALGHR